MQPVLHLCLFALLVKLFAIVRERDKWQASIGVFFLFLAAMGTSVHPAIVLYLVGFLVLALVLLTRFAFLHVLAGFGREDPALARIPLRGFLLLATRRHGGARRAALPPPAARARAVHRRPRRRHRHDPRSRRLLRPGDARLDRPHPRQPRGGHAGAGGGAAAQPSREMRFKAATYDVYQGGTWRRSPSAGPPCSAARACASASARRSPSAGPRSGSSRCTARACRCRWRRR